MAERNGKKSIDLPSDPSFVISGDASDQRRRKDSSFNCKSRLKLIVSSLSFKSIQSCYFSYMLNTCKSNRRLVRNEGRRKIVEVCRCSTKQARRLLGLSLWIGRPLLGLSLLPDRIDQLPYYSNNYSNKTMEDWFCPLVEWSSPISQKEKSLFLERRGLGNATTITIKTTLPIHIGLEFFLNTYDTTNTNPHWQTDLLLEHAV